MAEPIYIVFGGQFVLGAYRSLDNADLHKRCVTGAHVVPTELLDRVPREIMDDLVNEFDSDQDDDTPVVPIQIDQIDEIESDPDSDE